MKKRLLAGVLILASLFLFACGNEQPDVPTTQGTQPNLTEKTVTLGAEDTALTSRIGAAIETEKSIFGLDSVSANLHFGFKSVIAGKPYFFENMYFELHLANDSGETYTHTIDEPYSSYGDCFFVIGLIEIPTVLFTKESGEIYYTAKLNYLDESAASDVVTLYYAKDENSIVLSKTPITATSDVATDEAIYVGDTLSVACEERLSLTAIVPEAEFDKSSGAKIKAYYGRNYYDKTERYDISSFIITAEALGGGKTTVYTGAEDMAAQSYDRELDKRTDHGEKPLEFTLPASLFTNEEGIVKLELTAYGARGTSDHSNSIYVAYTVSKEGKVKLSAPSEDFKTYKVTMDLSGDKIEWASLFKEGVKSSYAPGELVQIKLLETTQAYTVYAGDVEAEYVGDGIYTFVMPAGDCEIEIAINPSV